MRRGSRSFIGRAGDRRGRGFGRARRGCGGRSAVGFVVVAVLTGGVGWEAEDFPEFLRFFLLRHRSFKQASLNFWVLGPGPKFLEHGLINLELLALAAFVLHTEAGGDVVAVAQEGDVGAELTQGGKLLAVEFG